VAEPTDLGRIELEIIIELLRRLQSAFPGFTDEQAITLAEAVLAVGPAKRRKLLESLLIATASRSTLAKASDSPVLRSTVCSHGYIVGKCPLC
jgi:hypothetical protein